MNKAALLFTLLIALIFAGCISNESAVMETDPQAETGALVGYYKLRALDPLQISLLGIPDEKMLESVIDERGNISLPYIDEPVPAVGLTTSELERTIRRIYTDGEIYRDITVNVQTYAKIYYMEGEVERPQEYELNRRITLLQAIAAASGYTEYANRAKVSITRNGKVTTFNAKDIAKHPERDVAIEAGDRIRVHRSIW